MWKSELVLSNSLQKELSCDIWLAYIGLIPVSGPLGFTWHPIVSAIIDYIQIPFMPSFVIVDVKRVMCRCVCRRQLIWLSSVTGMHDFINTIAIAFWWGSIVSGISLPMITQVWGAALWSLLRLVPTSSECEREHSAVMRCLVDY